MAFIEGFTPLPPFAQIQQGVLNPSFIDEDKARYLSDWNTASGATKSSVRPRAASGSGPPMMQMPQQMRRPQQQQSAMQRQLDQFGTEEEQRIDPSGGGDNWLDVSF